MDPVKFDPSWAQRLFKTFDEKNRLKMYYFLVGSRRVDDYIKYYDYFLTIPGIFSNFLHILILSRKDMRASSINVIMIGLGFYDVLLMLYATALNYKVKNKIGLENCLVANTYTYVYFSMSIEIGGDFIMRCTLWLAIIMATLRTLSIRSAMTSDFTIPKYGWKSILYVTLISFLMTYWFKTFYEVYEVTDYDEELYDYYYGTSPDEPSCEKNLSLNYKLDTVGSQLYSAVHAVIAYIIPCIAFPILTTMLLNEFRKARERRSKMTKQIEKVDRTTVLVTYIAVSFMVAELPKGFARIVTIIDRSEGIWLITETFKQIFDEVSYFNAATRGIVCYAMSTQYRSNAKKLFRCGKKNKVVATDSYASSVPQGSMTISKGPQSVKNKE